MDKTKIAGGLGEFLFSSLVPEGVIWKGVIRDGLKVATASDIIFLGKANIRKMIQKWRATSRGLVETIKEAEDAIITFQGLTNIDICQRARGYENPKFPLIRAFKGEKPWPDDELSQIRKTGSTTLNVCGWCNYAFNGNCLNGCYVTAYCWLRYYGGVDYQEFGFNTPCFLKTASPSLIREIVDCLGRYKAELSEMKKEADERIEVLFGLEKQAEEKPALPLYRPEGWFKKNKPICCYLGETEEKLNVPSGCGFANARIDLLYTDGHVTVSYPFRIHSNEFLGGCGLWFRFTSPLIMYRWEFEYLQKHLDYAKLWARNGETNCQEFTASRFLQALEKSRDEEIK